MTAKLSMRKYKIKIHVFFIKSNNAKYNQFNHHKEIILNDSEYMHNVNNTSEQLVQANLMQCPISCSVADNDLLPASYFRHRLRSWSCRRTVVRRTRFAGGWPLLSRKMSDSAVAQSRRRASIRVHTVGWEWPTRVENPRFHASHMLLVRAPPRTVASWTFHTSGANVGLARRTRSAGTDPSSFGGGWILRNFPVT